MTRSIWEHNLTNSSKIGILKFAISNSGNQYIQQSEIQ